MGRRVARVTRAGLTSVHYAVDPTRPPIVGSMLNIASFDPGSRNFGIRIEQRWSVEQPWDRTRLILLAKWDLTQRGVPLMVSCVQQLHRRLTELASYLSRCHYILVEQQMPINSTAYRVAQHVITQCWGYIVNNNLNSWLVELNSRLKGERLHAPRGIDIKHWSIEEAQRLSQQQLDHDTLTMLQGRGKRDELSDTTIQIQAWLIDQGLIPVKST